MKCIIIISYQPTETTYQKMETKISAKNCIENVDDQLIWKENCELDNQLFWNGGSIHLYISQNQPP